MNSLAKMIRSRQRELDGLVAEREAHIVRGYEAGASATDLAADFGVTASTVYKMLHRNGVPLRHDHHRRRPVIV